jgi:hypothetical protein
MSSAMASPVLIPGHDITKRASKSMAPSVGAIAFAAYANRLIVQARPWRTIVGKQGWRCHCD